MMTGEFGVSLLGAGAESFGDGLGIEHKLSSAANAAVSPEEVEARRAAVQERGRTQG